jgi:hypothetical protein
MADGISFSMVTEPYMKWSDERQVKMRRAAMWTVREGGRIVKRAARAKAPVLKDRNAVRFAAFKKSAHGAYADQPVAGLLKNSIATSRRIHQVGDTYSVKVGPRGQRVHLYAAKAEARTSYMRDGFAAAEALMQAVSEDAYGRVWKGV